MLTPTHVQRRHSVERYRPTLDWWVAVLVGLVILIFLASIPFLLASSTGTPAKIIATLGVIFVILYMIDLSFFCTYILAAEELQIVSQLRSHRFAYKDMTGLRSGNMFGLISVPGKKRFALSANCLVISMTGNQWKKITVSPSARDRFIESLVGRTENLSNGITKK